jgi:hypothetical protein
MTEFSISALFFAQILREGKRVNLSRGNSSRGNFSRVVWQKNPLPRSPLSQKYRIFVTKAKALIEKSVTE